MNKKANAFFAKTFEIFKTFFLKKNALTFLVFLLLSFLFWLLNMSGQNQDMTVSFDVYYINIPRNILLKDSLPEKIRVGIRDFGRNNFKYSLSGSQSLTIDLSDAFSDDTVMVYPGEKLAYAMSEQLMKNARIVTMPADIKVRYRKQQQKLLPVKFAGKIELSSQRILSDEIGVEPSYVDVFGPKSVVDTMQYAYARYSEPHTIETTQTMYVSLEHTKETSFVPPKVKLTIPVEPITEKKLTVPVTGKNFPANIYLQTFPSSIEIFVTIGISKFNQFNDTDFSVELDYIQLRTNKTGKDSVHVVNHNPHNRFKNIRFYPSEVEFLLEEHP